MTRVKFATKHEYEYLGNYKILQNCFTSHKLDKVRTAPTRRDSVKRAKKEYPIYQYFKNRAQPVSSVRRTLTTFLCSLSLPLFGNEIMV
jgi:hypothetical protein